MNHAAHRNIAEAMRDAAAARDERIRLRLGQSLEDVAAITAQEWQEMSSETRELLLGAIEERGRTEGARANRTPLASPPSPNRSRLRKHLTVAWIRLATLPPLRTACVAGLLAAVVSITIQVGLPAMMEAGLAAAIDRQRASTGHCKRLSLEARGCRYRVQQTLPLAYAAEMVRLSPEQLRTANRHLAWPASAGSVVHIPSH